MLAVRWLFPGQEVRADTRCLDCGEAITIRMRDDELLEVTPDTAVGYMTSLFSLARIGSLPFH